MNHDLLIKITNRVAIYATVALIYWVFAFLTITVFDLKIFRERITEMFLLSVLGIFAILGGAIILNVMSNLSKISTAVSSANESGPAQSQVSKPRLIAAGLFLPLIVALLFIGNNLSAERKKDMLIRAAESLVSENQASLSVLADYKFTPEYVKNTKSTLSVLNKIDRSFPEVMVIFPDVIDGKHLYLGFGGGRYGDDKEEIGKSPYIYSTSREERDYLDRIFATDQIELRFHADAGNYQLYFPTLIAGRKLVLYFSDFQRYGKFGS